MSDTTGDAGAGPDDSQVLKMTVDRNPESGVYTAQVRSADPMIVKGYTLAEVFKAVWDNLVAREGSGRIAPDIIVDFKYKHLREDNDRLRAEVSQFATSLSRMIDLEHPHGPVTTMDQVRELAAAAFVDVRRVERARLTAWREGALMQTEASTGRDLLQALCAAVNDFLPLLPPNIAGEAAGSDAPGAALGRLRAVLAACDPGTA
jgi:hypothetical protein